MALNLDIVWYFFIYAFLGWCTEVVYAAVKSGSFVNRGFLNGALCPIYGLGVIFVLFLLNPVKSNIFYLFCGAAMITSAMELVVGFLLEKIFQQKWWDYSDIPFNIGGYICLKFSLAWGLACLVVVDRIQPLVISFVDWLPQTTSEVLLITLTGLFLVDAISTVQTILRLNQKLELIEEITQKIKKASDNIGENLATGTITLVHKKDNLEEKIGTDISEIREARHKALAHRRQLISDLYVANRELFEGITWGQRRLLKAFPGSRSVKYREALESMKNAVNRQRVAKTIASNGEHDRTGK